MNPQSDKAPQVLISGAGPTGLMLAGQLVARGIRCRIIDKAAVRSPHSRALVVQPRQPGYAYCYAQDPATQAIRRVFPNRFQPDPFVRAVLEEAGLPLPAGPPR